jgi:ketosteroid isomerase-like protein
MEPRAAIENFYKAFSARDAAGMVACYHPEVAFSDPVFQELDAPQVRAMWRMLCERGKDLRIEASAIEATGDTGRAHWEAWYTFSATGRKVHNVIEARFRFKDGLIVRHDDTFGFYRWTRMALGPMGVVLGWSPPIQGTLRKKAKAGLADFMAKQPG